jgi:hypothetical protein
MRKGLALIALAIAGFAFGFAGCGEDDEGSPGGDVTVTTSNDTTTDDTETNGTTTDENGGRDY